MDTVALGRSGLQVTPLCFGTWEYSGEWGNVDERAATTTIRRARELGINFFDTAQAYGFGTSERILGAALAGELRTARGERCASTRPIAGRRLTSKFVRRRDQDARETKDDHEVSGSAGG